MKDKNGVDFFGEDESAAIYRKFIEIIDKGADKDTIDKSDFITQLKEFLADEKYAKILGFGDSFYRARNVSYKDYEDESKGFKLEGDYLSGFNEKESGAPQRKKSVMPPQKEELKGRCDIDNTTILYAANNIETACCEVRPLFTEIISVATYAVKKPLKLFNVTHDIPTKKEYFSCVEIGTEISKQNIWSRFVNIFAREFREAKYNISQIISQYIYSYGFDGIIYYSSQSTGLNYAFFIQMNDSIQWVESQLYICTQKQLLFCSLNNQQPLCPVNRNIDMVEVQKIKRNTIKCVVESRKKNRKT